MVDNSEIQLEKYEQYYQRFTTASDMVQYSSDHVHELNEGLAKKDIHAMRLSRICIHACHLAIFKDEFTLNFLCVPFAELVAEYENSLAGEI